MARVKSLRELLKDFAEWTSIPGPIQIVYALNTFTRLLWVLIWLALFGVFVYQFVLIVQKYAQFPTEVSTVLGFQREKRFPVVTICKTNVNNQFPFNSDFIGGGDFRQQSKERAKTNASSSSSSAFRRELWAKTVQRLLTAAAATEDSSLHQDVGTGQRAFATGSQQQQRLFDEFVLECRFNGVPCQREDFVEHRDPMFGVCFRFHGGRRRRKQHELARKGDEEDDKEEAEKIAETSTKTSTFPPPTTTTKSPLFFVPPPLFQQPPPPVLPSVPLSFPPTSPPVLYPPLFQFPPPPPFQQPSTFTSPVLPVETTTLINIGGKDDQLLQTTPFHAQDDAFPPPSLPPPSTQPQPPWIVFPSLPAAPALPTPLFPPPPLISLRNAPFPLPPQGGPLSSASPPPLSITQNTTSTDVIKKEDHEEEQWEWSRFTHRTGAGDEVAEGLHLTLNTASFATASASATTSTTSIEGAVRLALNAELNEEPVLDAHGLNFGPGRHWDVAIENSKVRLLRPPYGRCVDRLGEEDSSASSKKKGTKRVEDFYANGRLLNENQNNSAFRYDMANCLRSCRQRQVLDACGCADPRYPKPEDAGFCSLENAECLVELEARLYWDRNFTSIKNCGCPPACHLEAFELSVSSLHLLRDNPQNHMGGAFPPPPPPLFSSSPFVINPEQQQHPLRGLFRDHRSQSQLCSIRLHFRSMDTTEQLEKATYTLVKASNDLGGQMGLWLGVSVISIFELLALIVMIIVYFLQVPAVRVVPYPEEYEANPRFRQVQALRRELDRHDELDRAIQDRAHAQQRAREQRRARAQEQLARAEAVLTRARERVRAADGELARRGPEDAPARALAANTRALARGAALRVEQLRKLVSEI